MHYVSRETFKRRWHMRFVNTYRCNHKIIVVNTITGASYEFNNIVSQVEIADIQTYEMITRKCVIITLIDGDEIRFHGKYRIEVIE